MCLCLDIWYSMYMYVDGCRCLSVFEMMTLSNTRILPRWRLWVVYVTEFPKTLGKFLKALWKISQRLNCVVTWCFNINLSTKSWLTPLYSGLHGKCTVTEAKRTYKNYKQTDCTIFTIKCLFIWHWYLQYKWAESYWNRMVQLFDSGIRIPTVVVLMSGFAVEVILLRQLCIFPLVHPIFLWHSTDGSCNTTEIITTRWAHSFWFLPLSTIHLVIQRQ